MRLWSSLLRYCKMRSQVQGSNAYCMLSAAPMPGAGVVLVHKHAVAIRVWVVEGEILLGNVSVVPVLARVECERRAGLLHSDSLGTACCSSRQSCASCPI